MSGTNYLFQLILDHCHRSCAVSAVLTYLSICILVCIVYNGLYVFILLHFIGLLL